MAEILNFDTENFIGYLDSRWVLNNALMDSNGYLVIQAGGTAQLELIEEVNEDFKYVKVRVEYSSDGVNAENNYKSNPTVFIKEAYKDSNNSIDTVVFRALGFNTFETTAKGYLDTTIYQTLNKPMSKLLLTITNNTNYPLTIYSLSMYKSIDISQSQTSKYVQRLNKSGSMVGGKVYHNEDEVKSLNGLGVFVQGGMTELKFRPTYYQGQLIAIETNYGQVVSFQHLVEQINLETS